MANITIDIMSGARRREIFRQEEGNRSSRFESHGSSVPVVVLFEPASDEFSYKSKFVPLLTSYFDFSLFQVYVVGSSGLKSSLMSTECISFELPIGYVGHRGPTRFLRYVLSLILSTFLLVRAIRVSRSRVLVTMAGHCYSGFVIALVGKIMKRKVIVRLSEPTRALLKKNRRPGLLYVVTSWTERLSLSLSDAVFTVRDMSDYCTLPSGKARVIGQGVNIQQIEESSPADLKEHFSPAIVTVARLDSEKGIERLIDSVALLVGKFPGIGCFIVGWGPEMSSLRQRVSERSLESHVVFTGYIPPSQVPMILKACDIFVLPSDLEGVPSAILEAMACGLPVVTCLRTGSFAEMMRKFNAALAVTTEPKAIADAIETLLINTQQRENTAKSGIRYVRTYHDNKESRKAFSSLILQVEG